MMSRDNVVLFDGICNLCNGFVNFIIERDKKKRFVFGTLQERNVQDILKIMKIEDGMQSVIYIESGKTYTESTAALRILKKLGGIWSLAFVLIVFPKFIRDGVYRWIAKNRYKFFGKRNECRMPEPSIEDRFIK